jgi:alanine dehydrogenase
VTAPETLILTRRDIAGLMGPDDWLIAVETGFRAAAEGRAHAPPPMHLESQGGAFHAKGANLELGRSYVALKLNGNFPGNPEARGLPTIQGAMLLCDGETGSLLAVMDSIEVTLRRTAAATALAARFLARPDSATILICGCGEQGAAQLAALQAVLPLRRCLAWDRDPARMRAFAGEAVADLAAAAAASDVIVACTTAREPYLEPAFVRPGTFVAAVGADSPEKSEVQPELMAEALVVADILDQCAAMGDLRHALRAGALRREDVHAELSELVTGAKPGRSDDAQITLFDSTGTALQDVAAAALIYERALQRPPHLSVAMGAAA